MSFLDIRTVMFSQILTDTICAVVLLNLWRQNRMRYDGLSYLAGDLLFQTLAVVLLTLRASLPAWLAMGVANTLVIAGALLGYLGLERFVEKRSLQIHNYLILAAFILVHFYFIYIQPNFEMRNLNVSLGLLIMTFQCAWLMLKRTRRSLLGMTRAVGWVFVVFCLVSLIRIFFIVGGVQPVTDFFQSGLYDALILVTYQILLILLAFGLAAMVNRRLITEISIQEEKFTKAFHSSQFVITITRLPDGQILEINDGFTAITGYTRTEAVGKTTLEIKLWADEQERTALIEELSRRGQVKEKEYQFRIKSGEMMTGLFSAESILINDQLCLVSNIIDITERKKMEIALKQSEAHYRLLAENMVDVIWRLSPTGEFTYISPSVERLRGFTVEEVLSQSPAETLTPNSVRVMLSALAENMPKIESGEPKVEGESRIYELEQPCKDGSTVWTEALVKPLFDESDKFDGFMGVSRDITERKRAEHLAGERMKELQAFYNLSRIIETEGISIDKVYQEFAAILPESWQYPQSACARIVIDEKEFRTKNFAESAWMQSAPIKAYRSVIGKVEVGYLEQEPQEYEGPFLKEERQLIDAIAERLGHVTERMRAEELIRLLNAGLEQRVAERTRELKEAQDRLVRQEKLSVLGQMAGSVGHELRNPLGVINTAVYYLKMVQPDVDEKIKEKHAMIEEEVHKADKIIGDLLGFARVITAERERVPVEKLVRQTLEHFPAPAEVEVAVDLPADLPEVFADPRQVEQVLSNLVTNGYQAMIDGGQLSVISEQFSENGTQWVRISVKDTGTGISPENMKKLFEPLFTTKTRGIGLGLAVSKKLAEANGGRIEVESKVGKGSTFTLVLPAVKP